ncbi:hypothetical protein [Pseudonocardia nigra]|uniref:hypothetical protein n=1 Tax=Pseudonocardia nigra TaxID=1921578 RepID=UPI001C605000|nr:hypothetical protein [Pseudonocardia nigra]
MTADHRNGDETQRARLARMLRDPSRYYADARRQAHEQARRLLAARLSEPEAHSPGRP